MVRTVREWPRSRTLQRLITVAVLLCLLVALLLAHAEYERREARAERRLDQFLGATIAPLNEETAMSVEAPSYDKGVIVTSLARGGPGQRAGS